MLLPGFPIPGLANVVAGGGGGGGDRVALTDSDAVSNSGTVATYTFSSENLGAADAGRHIIVTVTGWGINSSNSELNSATIGGVSATIAAYSTDPAPGFAAILIAAVPTGTTGDIVLTTNATNEKTITIAVYRAVDLASATPTDTDATTSSGTSASITPASGTEVIAVGVARQGSATLELTNVTEEYDYYRSASFEHRGLHGRTSGTGSALTVGWTEATTQSKIALASFD